ncbi:transglycosylase SLT domain-containing protein [Devosia sp. MC521]|uniref:transglycosylase SLT domain-containing protein n=1 Tax=Devosia sp. MC521 TaxID=2759954 RepID=UPI0015F88E96|nr:transglycosylase SLT domain-containing protein [Devosia sp. MC521]MBJ6986100.1 transglycosylase SLT domain-containing protein [Devosia sp. MC521]QMW61469.1 transglycosylase SLT domain-containing protein [Devosia sp. MC521]
MGIKPVSIPQNLVNALTAAGEKSGVDFSYLLQTAVRESSLNPSAKARTSSAVGLFQFLEGTWLQVMKTDGPRLGYQRYADEITRTPDGDYVVRDPRKKAEILALRENPQIAADLAAAFTRSNGDFLKTAFGRMPSAGELYIAHFLGAQGAERMFQAGLQNPEQVAVNLFPKQANANQTIFYDGSGKPRTIREVYQVLVAKHNAEPNAGFAAQQISSSTPTKPIEPAVPSRFSPANMSFTGLFRTEPEAATDEGNGNAAFFTQLYSQ